MRLLFRGLVRRNSEVPRSFTQSILIVDSDKRAGLVTMPFTSEIGRFDGDFLYLAVGRNRVRISDENYRLKVIRADLALSIYETDSIPEAPIVILL